MRGNMTDKNKRIIIIIIVLAVMLTIVGGTLDY